MCKQFKNEVQRKLTGYWRALSFLLLDFFLLPISLHSVYGESLYALQNSRRSVMELDIENHRNLNVSRANLR